MFLFFFFFFAFIQTTESMVIEVKQHQEKGHRDSVNGDLTLLTTQSLRALFLPQFSIMASERGRERAAVYRGPDFLLEAGLTSVATE